MNEEMLTVATDDVELPGDDGRVEETSMEELVDGVMQPEEGGAQEKVEDTGDDGQSAAPTEKDANPKDGKKIRAILRSQRESIFRELGMSEDEVRELVRTHRAEQMAKDDPEISVKAAREILRAREEGAGNTDLRSAYVEQLKTLQEDGWTGEQLRALCEDGQARENLAAGMTLRQAARAYMMRQEEKPEEKPQRRHSVPTAKRAGQGAGSLGNKIEEMTDAQFREFSRRAEAAMMAGKRVRID